MSELHNDNSQNDAVLTNWVQVPVEQITGLVHERNLLLKALQRWRDEWVIGGDPAQKENNYSIEKNIQYVLKVCESSTPTTSQVPFAQMVGRIERKPLEKTKSLYDRWNDGEIGNFGSFHTAILQAYRLADNSNRDRLELAFPEWFK